MLIHEQCEGRLCRVLRRENVDDVGDVFGHDVAG